MERKKERKGEERKRKGEERERKGIGKGEERERKRGKKAVSHTDHF